MANQIIQLIEDAITTVTGDPFPVAEVARTYQAKVVGTGAVTATVVIEGSNDTQAVVANKTWVLLGTITLSGTTSDTDGFGSVLPWQETRARITAVSGTDATVNVNMGV
ncbi:hypothetical protein KAR91_56370 [Candidatus Pacearchaeota archaeon]|nr:hypothetical protein [Candidatus Pacearchaeota archaeon]